MKRTLKEKVSAISEHLRLPLNFTSMAIISAVLIGLSYALYLRSLGIYFDDWPQMYSLVVGGAQGIKEYYIYDSRPLCVWPELLFFKIWGTNPILWHLANYFIHWLASLSIYFVFKELWPENKRVLLWVSLLFAVYPLFDQQSVALVYLSPRLCLLFFFISVYFMIRFAKEEKGKYLYLVISLLLNVVNLFTVEYLIGLELIRPFILFFAFKNLQRSKPIKRALLHWLPYVGLVVALAIWRLLLVDNYRGLSVTFFNSLMSAPVLTIGKLLEFVLKDLISIIVTVWYPALNAAMIDLNSPVRLVALGTTVLVFIALLVLFHMNQKQNLGNETGNATFIKQQMIIGLLGVIFGCVPFWLIMRSYSEAVSVYVDRFGYPSMWAAALFLVALISYAFNGNVKRSNFIVILLISLAVGQNIIQANNYKWSTIWQHRILSQLKWRAPSVAKGTLFLSDIELFTNMGVYPTAFALNLLYEKDTDYKNLDYYYLTLSKYFTKDLHDLASGVEVTQKRWYSLYEGNTSKSLVLQWNRTDDQCLWVLSSNDRYNPLIPENTRVALAASDLDNINVFPEEASWPDENIFGREDQDTWCYYYESADLARQRSDWDAVTELYFQAKTGGYSPSNGVELIPFIEGFAMAGNADIALDLTLIAKSLTPNLRDYTCDTWNRLSTLLSGDPLFDSEYKTYADENLCWEVK